MDFRWLLSLPLGSIALPATAQPADGAEQALSIAHAPEAEITVLAGGNRENLANTGQKISIFTRHDIEQVQGPDLDRLLERAPGVTISRNGGLGSFTGVRVRGAEAEQLLVLIDGVRAADPAAPGGGFDFGNLLMGNLAKVELQRSSNSTIWGSQALGGVLAATTASGRGGRAAAEFGARQTVYGTAGATFDGGPATIGLHAAHLDTEGFSAAAAGSEPDGFRQTELGGQARIALGAAFAAFTTARYAEGRLELDGFPAPAFTLADTAEYQLTQQLSGLAGLEYAGPALDLRAALSRADTERENFDPALGPAPGFSTDGTAERAELRGQWRLSQEVALNFGGEREWQRFATLFDPERSTAITGGYAQLDYGTGRLRLAAGVRRDEHRDFGGRWSFGADAAWDLAGGWRLTGSAGEGFKAPTLFQLHSDFGNAQLRPERSRSYDLGLGFARRGLRAQVTVFRRDTEGLIGFVSCFGVSAGICAGRPFGTYDNVGRARAQGLEVEGQATIAVVTLGAAYTLLDAEDRTADSATRGNDLARRPNHALTLTGDLAAGGRTRFGADLRVVSDSFDDAANRVPIAGYATLTLRGEWDASERVTLFGRVENLWDEHYQTAAGYATSGRAAYLGARARW
jgi:vitamin B12 transporter